MATVLENTPPFKTVLGFASLLAEDGRPMHKSWGNAIEFNQGAGQIGVDIMRWLYCRQNPGQNAKTHPEVVINYLKTGNWLLKTENYSHRYPTCWRCKTELVWKVTDEWYIAMDRGKPSLRQRMIRVAKKIRWIPEFGLDRELDWLKNMHDWLISKKNRYWGLCLPIWECSKCGHFEVIGSREELETKAVSGWHEFEGKSPHKPQLDQVKIKCPQCGQIVSRIEPVGNPWLDAGIIPFSTLNYTDDSGYWSQWYPSDFIP